MENEYPGTFSAPNELPPAFASWFEEHDAVNEIGRDPENTETVTVWVDPDTDISDKAVYPDELNGTPIVYIHAEPPELLIG